MEDELLNIFNRYGKSHQVSKLLEEVGELIETIINEDKENMVQELADVMVVLYQFKLHYGITDNQIKEVMKYKILRQKKRMDEENEK